MSCLRKCTVLMHFISCPRRVVKISFIELCLRKFLRLVTASDPKLFEDLEYTYIEYAI